MPITQSRMIALINAGRDYKQAFETARASIEQHYTAVTQGEESATDAINALFLRTIPSLLVTDMNSAAVLEVEFAHFRTFQRKNTRAAKAARARRARGEAGPGAPAGSQSSPSTPPSDTWAVRAAQASQVITAESELDFGTGQDAAAAPALPLPPGGSLTEAQKAQITTEAAQLAASLSTEYLCKHPEVDKHGRCRVCFERPEV